MRNETLQKRVSRSMKTVIKALNRGKIGRLDTFLTRVNTDVEPPAYLHSLVVAAQHHGGALKEFDTFVGRCYASALSRRGTAFATELFGSFVNGKKV